MTDKEEGPRHLRVAAENDQKTVDREMAKRDIKWPLRELAANIIRVVRGAGKSYEIAGQCLEVIEAFQRYRDKVGHWPSSWEIDEALSIRDERENNAYDEAWERECARESVVRGCLQVAASRLMGQNTQEQRGRSEMMEGVRELERIHDESRKKLAEQERALRAKLKTPRSTPKPRKTKA